MASENLLYIKLTERVLSITVTVVAGSYDYHDLFHLQILFIHVSDFLF